MYDKGSNISSIRTIFFWEGLSFQCANWQNTWFFPYPVTSKRLCCVPWHINKNQIHVYLHELLKMLAYFLFNVINFNLGTYDINFFYVLSTYLMVVILRNWINRCHILSIASVTLYILGLCSRTTCVLSRRLNCWIRP